MDDFRLKVFYSVSKNQSFTKAAAELYISQPAITKHIKLLEESLGCRLFERKGNCINLTASGEVLFKYATEIFQLYQEALFELGAMKNQFQGQFRLGASTTVSQYLISPILASFYEKFPQIKLTLLNGNSEIIENAVLSKSIDLGIVEGKKHNSSLKYTDFVQDELVAVVHAKSRFSNKNTIQLSDLTTIPLVLRERGSGTLEVIQSSLKENGIKLSNLSIVMHLGSTESIKSFLEYSNALSFVSIRAIKKELKYGELKIINIENLKMLRTFSFVTLHGQQENIASAFIQFTNRHYNNK
ncbi:HTH-type transcriptional regulator CysL [Emticicia aquatica]|uniref:HTH-type transcriptional regulator CysL n=1 Tax=Emticicia aquatica TaxID=1681835 RepID=A0ABN8EXT2_9BACT|nr:LysR substrate-binding domain-containing protein [Emticicia aquatica]CAH0996500.1 HTH-type transcriptional regulator CysL [Emticicia aquatica]